MRGFFVERRFGWDVHGLPIEMEVQKELGLEDPQDIDDYGIDKFNEACRSQVQTNTENWEKITRKIGRWVDFENDYKTMDVGFMESVWWVFKELYDKGLIYKDYKVLPSPGLQLHLYLILKQIWTIGMLKIPLFSFS